MVFVEVVVRVEFRQGLPEGCVNWLCDNVGRGNITGIVDGADYAWFYERVLIPVPIGDTEPWYVPTVTVKDPKLATLFVLRWS
jgi:hypothetical protein